MHLVLLLNPGSLGPPDAPARLGFFAHDFMMKVLDHMHLGGLLLKKKTSLHRRTKMIKTIIKLIRVSLQHEKILHQFVAFVKINLCKGQ